VPQPGPKIVPIRCPSNSYGYAVDASGMFEIRCKGKFCRSDDEERPVVFHLFDLETGTILRTEASPYQDPRVLLGGGIR
jgi:hypothetical protein